MKEVTEHKECVCGSKDRVSKYNKDTDEGTEFCDVCGEYVREQIVNIPPYHVFPTNWIPEYKKTIIKTGYVLKVWIHGKDGFVSSCVYKDKLKLIIADLTKEEKVIKFAITFKDKNGNFQTQIFKT